MAWAYTIIRVSGSAKTDCHGDCVSGQRDLEVGRREHQPEPGIEAVELTFSDPVWVIPKEAGPLCRVLGAQPSQDNDTTVAYGVLLLHGDRSGMETPENREGPTNPITRVNSVKTAFSAAWQIHATRLAQIPTQNTLQSDTQFSIQASLCLFTGITPKTDYANENYL